MTGRVYPIVPHTPGPPRPREKRHCWLRLRRHRFGEPFKRFAEAVSIWRQCRECEWVSLVGIDEGVPDDAEKRARR